MLQRGSRLSRAPLLVKLCLGFTAAVLALNILLLWRVGLPTAGPSQTSWERCPMAAAERRPIVWIYAKAVRIMQCILIMTFP